MWYPTRESTGVEMVPLALKTMPSSSSLPLGHVFFFRLVFLLLTNFSIYTVPSGGQRPKDIAYSVFPRKDWKKSDFWLETAVRTQTKPKAHIHVCVHRSACLWQTHTQTCGIWAVGMSSGITCCYIFQLQMNPTSHQQMRDRESLKIKQFYLFI